MQRDLRRNNNSKKFECNDCKTPLAFVDQCEHYLIANNGDFILQQFGKKLMQRSYAEGSLILYRNDDDGIENDAA